MTRAANVPVEGQLPGKRLEQGSCAGEAACAGALPARVNDPRRIAAFLEERAVLRLTLLFAVCTFARIAYLAQIHQGSTGWIPSSWQSILYYTNQLCEGLGVLAYALFKGRRGGAPDPGKEEHGPRSGSYMGHGELLSVTVCLMGGMVCGFALLPAAVLWTAVSQLTCFLFGYVLGAVCAASAHGMEKDGHMGRAVGVGYTIALLLQYLLQFAWGLRWGLLSSMLLAVLAQGFLLGVPVPGAVRWAGSRGDGRGSRIPSRVWEDAWIQRHLVSVCLFYLCMLVTVGFFDNLSQRSMVASGFTEGNVYSWPRVFWALGALAFGWIADRREGRYFRVSILAVSLLAVLIPFFLSRDGGWAVNACVYYILIGGFYSYCWIVFWRMAPQTENPALWAGMGAILDFFGGCLTPLFGFSSISAEALMLLYIAVLAAMLLLLVWGGDLQGPGEGAVFQGAAREAPLDASVADVSEDVSRECPVGLQEMGGQGAAELPQEACRFPAPADARSADRVTVQSWTEQLPDLSEASETGQEDLPEAIEAFAKQSSLTPRETDVLRSLLRSEETVSVLAAELGISERMFYRHMRHVCEKTGTETRAGLVRAFYTRSGISHQNDDNLP